MTKRYNYQIEFLSRDFSPSGTKFYSATGECLLNEMKKNFKDYCSKHAFGTKGSATKGHLLNAKGQIIGSFAFNSTTVE